MRSLLPSLLKLHRWLALVTAPILLLIILSGVVLAFKPIVEGGARSPVDVPVLITSLNKADPRGRAGSLSMAADGRSFELRSRGPGPSGRFDAASGVKTGELGFDLFAWARNLHENLLIGANWLVTLVTIVSVLLIVSGLLLGWRTLRHTLSGWHAGLGWLGLPLVALTPVTGLMMALHLGMPQLPFYEGGHPQPIARVLEIASGQTDLTRLSLARNFRRGAVMLTVQTDTRPVQLLVSGAGELQAVSPSWVRMLHEGNWAGAFSGVLNLFSALPLLGLLITGVLGWWRRYCQLNAAL
jgi:sulfite reductase (NADPH) flavoprotein alpha-component